MRQMAAGKFKAECLAVMDEVQAKREPVLITKHGKPVAKLVPVEIENGNDSLFGFLQNEMQIVGDPMDLVNPIVPPEEWDYDEDVLGDPGR